MEGWTGGWVWVGVRGGGRRVGVGGGGGLWWGWFFRFFTNAGLCLPRCNYAPNSGRVPVDTARGPAPMCRALQKAPSAHQRVDELPLMQHTTGTSPRGATVGAQLSPHRLHLCSCTNCTATHALQLGLEVVVVVGAKTQQLLIQSLSMQTHSTTSWYWKQLMMYFPSSALRCPKHNRKHHKERNVHHHTTSHPERLVE